jgi:ADP-heptose:LPS heptosyltransferase
MNGIRNKKVKQILIFKLCCFGDIVFITPAIEALRTNFPEARITLIASSWVRDLIPYLNVDEVLVFDTSQKMGLLKGFTVGLRLMRILRGKEFDLALLGHRKSVFGFILWLSGIQYRLGFKGTAFLNYTADFDENVHETQRYLNILRESGLRVNAGVPKLKQVRDKTEIRREFGIPLDKRVLGIFPFGGINPGTRMDIKRWGEERYLELAKRACEEFPNLYVILFEGLGEDEKLIPPLPPSMGEKKKINIDLISCCDVFVGGDTGPVHIAAALGVSTLTIFGPSNPNLVMPLSEGNAIHKIIWKKVECSPCYTPATAIDRSNKKYWRSNNFICHVGTHVCMKEISAEEVFEALNEILNSREFHGA